MPSKKSAKPVALTVEEVEEIQQPNISDFRDFHTEAITLTWQNINVWAYPPFKKCSKDLFKKKQEPRQILYNVNGIASPGEFLAIMGASGAGKTSLLNVISCHRTNDLVINGKLCANGDLIYLPTYPYAMAYLHQEDIFVGHVTVMEQLTFKANITMDRSISKEDKARIVNQTITEFRLQECKNSLIETVTRTKGISSGEKKRLSLAGELLSDPALIICDEPTSGLDSHMATIVVQKLRSLSENGKTVICSIHQPPSHVYAQFDKILLVALGRVAFLGNQTNAMKFFANIAGPCPAHYNPADYLIKNLAVNPSNAEESKRVINITCDLYDETRQKPKPELTEEPLRFKKFTRSHHPSPVTVWYGLVFRSWTTFIRNPQFIRLNFFQSTFVAFLVCTVYYQIKVRNQNDADGVVNIIAGVVMNLSFQSMTSVINTFTGEIEVFLREKKNKLYGLVQYMSARMIVEQPLYLLNPLYLVTLIYVFVGLNLELNKFLLACLVNILVSSCACGFGYMVGALCNDLGLALSIGPPLITPFILFGGYFISLDAIPSHYLWMTYFSWFRHGIEALMILQWDGFVAIHWEPIGGKPYPIGEELLNHYSFKPENFDRCILGLIGLNILFRALCFIIMLMRMYFND